MQVTVFVCLSVCLFGWEVIAQVGSLCRPNERLLLCGCPKTCKDPAPDCKGYCKEGCFCEEGMVRNDAGLCVQLSDCPVRVPNYREDTSEPRLQGGICPENEEYRFCEVCNRTCESPNPMCPAQCQRGCFCKRDLLRDSDGSCKKWTQCSNIQMYINAIEKEKVIVIPARYSCGPNKEYKMCQKCQKTCQNPNPDCDGDGACHSGCFCKDGLLKNKYGQCVPEDQCAFDMPAVVRV